MSNSSKMFSLSRRGFIVAAGIALGAATLPFRPAFASPESPTSIELNQTVTTEDYEFTFTSCEWSDAVYPPDTSSAYNYFPGESGKHYFIIHGRVKNLAGSACHLGAQSTVSFLFNEKYKYDGVVYTAVDDATIVNNQYSIIDPLETVNLYICALVPDELMDAFDNIQADWALYDLSSEYLLQSDEKPIQIYRFSYSQAANDENPKDNGAGTDGVPFDALILNNIRVDLDDDFYAFQLEGHQGYAWTADGTGTVAIEQGEGYDIPKSATDRDAFFANRITEYASGLGWTVTRSEKVELADSLEGHLNQADHGDGYSTTYINIPVDDSDFVQVYVIHPNDGNLPERVIQAIRKQTNEDSVPQTPNKTSTLSAAGITFESPVSDSQYLSYNALYSYHYDRTLQIIVEPFNGADIIGHVFNIDNDDMTDDPCSAEFFENYCQKFAASRNGWIMSSFSTEGASGTVSVCAIRSDQETGSFIYTLASTPTSMERTTYQLAIVIARCPLANAREWSPSIDAMIRSIEPTGAGVLTDYSFARHPGWQITLPDFLTSFFSDHDIWLDIYTASNLGFMVTMSTCIAPYGTYYSWTVIGDTNANGDQVISEETRDTAGANVWIRKWISSNSSYDRSFTVDIHSPTNNALGINLSYDHEDEEFLMPTIDGIINSISVS